MGKLTALSVRNAAPGVHVDGSGLLLRVKPGGARSWVLRVQVSGRRRDIGLGSISDLTLAEAREKAAGLRKAARQGLDPIAVRDRSKVAIPTFSQAIDPTHDALAGDWSDKAGEAFKTSLLTHAVPVIGRHRVSDIAAGDVEALLSPIWRSKPHQARKVLNRVLKVLTYSKVMGWRVDAVPTMAELRAVGIGKQPKGAGFRAVPYAEVPDLFALELAKDRSPARLALLFAILTAARSGEVRKAEWAQIDRARRIWRRPAAIMKEGEAHEVTLSPAALAVLDLAAEEFGQEEMIFPSPRKGGALTDMALLKMMQLAQRGETVHGFRSSFRTWAAEQRPEIPGAIAEAALAHSAGCKTERAYNRASYLELRFALLGEWGAFVAPQLGVES